MAPTPPASSLLRSLLFACVVPPASVALIVTGAGLALGALLSSLPFAATASLAALAALQVTAPAPARAVEIASAASAVSVGFLVWLSRVQRIALDGRERAPLSLLAAVALSLPPAVFAAVVAGVAPPSQGLSAAAILAPLLTAAAAARVWRARPSLEAAVALETALLKEALQGSGVTFSSSTIAGMHTVTFTRGGAMPPSTNGGAGVPSDGPSPPPILLLHGYASGSALWMLNVREIVETYSGPVFALDWRGCACSPRPSYLTAPSPPVAEAWFVDALEEWRVTQGFERVTLVGHSLGGYCAAAYYLRHSDRVSGLMLVSPVGIPLPPPPPPPGLGPAFTGGMVRNDPRAPAAQPRRIPWLAWAIMSRLWDGGITPGVVIRTLGPLGPWCARRAVRARASRWVLSRPPTAAAFDKLGHYMWHTQAVAGSGEHALSALLAPGAFAREPLLPRFRALLGGGPAAPAPSPIPIGFFYGGSHDWMSADAGDEAAALFTAAGFSARVHRIPRSGHHLYLESPDLFNAALLGECAGCK